MEACASQIYLHGSDIPKIYRERRTDDVAEKPIRSKKPEKNVKVVPMPFIQGNPEEGPLIVTDDWYVKEEKKKFTKQAKNKKSMQIDMMQLIAQRDQLNIELGKLDPGKKKDAKKIVYINIKLKDIDAELKMLQEQSGIDLNNLEHGTRFARFVGFFKRKFHHIKKKIKKFYRTYEEPINGLIAVIIPIAIAGVFKLISHLIA